MKIVFFPRIAVEGYVPKRKGLYLISMHNPGEPVDLVREAWKEIIDIECEDLNPESFKGREGTEYCFFKEKDAIEIINFSNRIEKESLIVIHCDAGVSRSGAVAKFLMEKFEVKNKQDTAGYNKYIYKKLKDCDFKTTKES